MSKMNASNWVCIGCTYRNMHGRQNLVGSEYELCEVCQQFAGGNMTPNVMIKTAKLYEKAILKRMGI